MFKCHNVKTLLVTLVLKVQAKVLIMENNKVPIPPEVSQGFTEIAQNSRILWHMITFCGDPENDSGFSRVEKLYPFEKVSNRARHYLLASLEHLVMWADFAAPFKFHPQQATLFTLRPTFALARAALESAAQAVWLLSAPDEKECLRRHLCLIRWDLVEYRKSRADDEGKAQVRQQDQELVERVSHVFDEGELRTPQNYLWMLQQACLADGLDLEAREVERLWRAASGASHGMYWTNLEFTKRVTDETNGHTLIVPDADAMLDVLRASEAMATFAAVQYLHFSGKDISSRICESYAWLVNQITPKPGADLDVLRRLGRDGPTWDK